MRIAGTDTALLSAAQRGDPAALGALLAAHRQVVFRYGLRYCRTTEDAEDAVQETLWAAARSIRKFRRTAAITTWLFTIVRNTCHRLLRQHRGEQDLADVLPTLADPCDLIPIDMTFSEQGEFLHVLNSGDHTITTFRGFLGQLTRVGSVTGLPVGANGLIAF